MAEIDPWGSVDIKDYARLFEEFGISPFKELLDRIKTPHLYMRRGIIFGHRGYEEVLRAMNERRAFAVMSGFMPSGKVHLGGKMVMDEIIWHQRMGGEAFACIADMEAHAVRGISWQNCRAIGINEYILSLVALGFDIEKGLIYFQSENKKLQELAFELGTEVNLSELSAIYGFQGDTHISHMMSVLVQNADILQPQLLEYGGPKPTVIPVGVDQDPHIRLTRDVASRMRMFLVEKRADKDLNPYISIRVKRSKPDAVDALAKRIAQEFANPRRYDMHLDIFMAAPRTERTIELALEAVENIVRAVELEYGGYSFYLPAATYHRFMQGLTGGKMSSSVPESYIALTEPPEEGAKKVLQAKTGGRATIEEQKKLGGLPEECTIYELLIAHLMEDDEEVKELFEECKSGKRLCKACKRQAAELMAAFLKKHQEERAHAREVLMEHEMYKEWVR